MTSDYGFYFEPIGMHRPRGLTNADEEIFRGSSVSQAVARELIQNSLDAKSSMHDGPVEVVFNLRNVRMADIPDGQVLDEHIRAADRDNNYDSQNPRLHDAVQAMDNDKIPVLRVGDYGTTGLSGSESIRSLDSGPVDDTMGTLLALTYASGYSVGKRDAGGSYGIGKSVGIRSSAVCTEFWTTRSEQGKETVFTGYTQLPTHRDPNSESRVDGQAMYIDRRRAVGKNRDLHYLRNPGSVMGFPERKDPGTDVYILGYLGGDSALRDIRHAVLDNFMAAVDRGMLQVHGIGESEDWVLDKETLPEQVECCEEHRAFYRALREKPIVGTDKDLGEMKLYLNVDDSFSKKYDTIVMRKPLMKVRCYKHPSIKTPFAAVFECSSEKGNALLRRMEPVSHDNWIGSNVPNGEAILNRVTKFIRKGIRSRIKEEMGNEIVIDDLRRLLPQGMIPAGSPNLRQSGGNRSCPEDSSGDTETSSVQGRPSDELVITNPERKSVPIQLSHPAISKNEGRDIEKGLDAGGQGNRGKHTVGLHGNGEEGHGASIIRSGDITFRTLYRQSDKSYLVVLHSRDHSDLSGSLQLTATLEGKVTQYVLPIVGVSDEDDQYKTFSISNGRISGVEIHAHHSTRLRVRIKGGRKMQLAVI